MTLASSTIRSATAPAEIRRPAGDEAIETDIPWIVIVWHDPINLLSYVTWVFQTLFGYPREKALLHDPLDRLLASLDPRFRRFTAGRSMRDVEHSSALKITDPYGQRRAISVLPTPVGPIRMMFAGKISSRSGGATFCRRQRLRSATATARFAACWPTTWRSSSVTISRGVRESDDVRTHSSSIWRFSFV